MNKVTAGSTHCCHTHTRAEIPFIEQPTHRIPSYLSLSAPWLAEGGELVDITEYVRNNAGKAFEFMLEVVEEDRKAAGLPDIATARAEAAEDPKVGSGGPRSSLLLSWWCCCFCSLLAVAGCS